MNTPLTFGVEFEMAVADGFDSGRDCHTDKRIIDFSFTPLDDDDDIPWMKRSSHSDDSNPWMPEEPWKRIARHMAATLRTAGFRSTVGKDDNSTWDFTCDLSIEEPQEDKPTPVTYTYTGIELRSPALYFTPESLTEVAEVLKLLKRTYCINTNTSTGLHVHVGDGKKGWRFHTIHKLLAFVWAFEFQLNTLFPPSRIDGDFTKSMRANSHYVNMFVQERGRPPTPMEGLVRLLNCESFEQLEKLFRPGTFRIAHISKYDHGRNHRKPTIEWRHHGGTMDEVSVCMWVRTVVGMLDFLRYAEPAKFTNLLSIVEHECWEKLGDGLDDQREQEMGPILAECEFTIIDLLQTIGLYEPAKFYKERGIYRIEVDSTRRKFVTSHSYWLHGPNLTWKILQEDTSPADPWADSESVDEAEIDETGAVMDAALRFLAHRTKCMEMVGQKGR